MQFIQIKFIMAGFYRSIFCWVGTVFKNKISAARYHTILGFPCPTAQELHCIVPVARKISNMSSKNVKDF